MLIEEPDGRALLSALFGIFAFLVVPLVFGSIRWWRTQQPQPVVMGGPGAGLDPLMYKVLFFSWFAMLALMTLLLRQRYRLEAMRGDLETMQHELEAVGNISTACLQHTWQLGPFFSSTTLQLPAGLRIFKDS